MPFGPSNLSPNQTEKSFNYSEGIMERPEAFIFFALMILFPNWFPVLASLFSALVFLTAMIRVLEFARHSSLN